MKEKRSKLMQVVEKIAAWDSMTKAIWVLDIVLLGFALYLLFPVIRNALLLTLAACTILYLEFGDMIRAKLLGNAAGRGVLCRSCIGCSRAYPAVRRTVFEAVRRFAGHLHIKVPYTEAEMEGYPPEGGACEDGRPRCFFRFMKTDIDYPVSDQAALQMMQKHLTECARSHPGRFHATGITDLYIEDIAQDTDSFLVTVMPYCFGATDQYIDECMTQQAIDEAPTAQGEVYDAF